MTTLLDLSAAYSLARGLSRGGAYLVRWSVGRYARHLGRPATVDDLTDGAVSGWLAAECDRMAPGTLAGHRTRLLCLWRWAARRGLVVGPGDVRRCRVPEPCPEAWTADEVGRLLAACPQLGAAGPWFAATIAAAWDSGLRRSDLRGLARWQIGPVIRLARQRKTGYSHEPRLRPDTVAAVLALPGDHPLACPWGPRRYGALWARLRRLAGIDGRGGCQRLRRSGATDVACQEGLEAASEFLGHRTAGMVWWYVDRSIYRPRGHLPPRVVRMGATS
jgi:hypothetical protein